MLNLQSLKLKKITARNAHYCENCNADEKCLKNSHTELYGCHKFDYVSHGLYYLVR